MQKNKIEITHIDQLVPDDLNNNKGTEYGQHLVENSLRRFGAARSIVLDKNNRIICGNKTVENAGAIGLENVIVVETTGDMIVAVKRTDLDLYSPQGRELALADNASAKANIEWDEENIQQIAQDWGIDPTEWGLPEFDEVPEEKEEEEPKEISTRLIVECGDVMKLSALYSELQDRGFTCELKE